MIHNPWVISILFMPLLLGCSTPLVRPTRIDWNSALIPKTVRVDGHTIFYTVKGEGNPLILIHGYGAGIWVWEKQMEILSQHNQVYALDVIGYGFSGRPKIPYTPEAYIRFLKDFMDTVGIEKATLIGNSMGGGIAWGTAILFPERVDRLVLIDCVPPDVFRQVKNESLRTLIAIRNIPLIPYLVISARSRSTMKWVLADCISDVKLITPEVVERQYEISRIKGTTWVLYSTLKHGEEALKLREQFSLIRQPVLFIWGEKDKVFPPEVGETLHRALNGSKLQLIEKSGHIPMWESPDPVNQAILEFLKN